MDYELTEDLLRKIWMRGGFRGIADGNEETHGPVEITGFYLKDPPKAEETMLPAFPRTKNSLQSDAAEIEAFELPDLQPAAKALSAPAFHGVSASRPASTLLPAMFGTLAGLAALATAAFAVIAAVRRRRGSPAAPYVVVNPTDMPPRQCSQEFGA
mmetsp:Transcript_16060/g.43337  ORF Transcript_16060/g.43337 Transcript_16060/m.43337 type:complete len:156 (-) Transcript_16060:270-737(-)